MTGSVIAIGGHEDRQGERTILRSVADRLHGAPLLLLTAASEKPAAYEDIYQRAFAGLGVEVVGPGSSAAALGGVFISGGSQARFMDSVRGELLATMRELWERGGVVAGTSAGASVLGAVMLARGPGEESPEPSELELAEGLDFVPHTIIDQHFTERGRIGRLVAALERRDGLLGIGIDEDTAIIIDGAEASVIGAGSVYLLDPVGEGSGHPEFRLGVLKSGDETPLSWAQGSTS